MARSIKSFCDFLKSFGRIERTSMNLIILILPFTLLFIALQLLLINSSNGTGAVVSNALTCADVGKEMLAEGGSVVDAAIATMLCEGVHLPNRAGLGGGFTAIMYITGRFDTITATVKAPANFNSEFLPQLSAAQAVGVPGELLGYWSMHKKYGQLPWKRLFEPAIKMCSGRVPLEEWDKQGMIQLNFETFPHRDDEDDLPFVDYNETSTLSQLGKTLQKVAENGPDVFYKGEIGKKIIDDLRSEGGVMTEDDLRNYTVSWNSRPLSFKLTSTTKAYTTPLPSAGAIVVFVMNIIKNTPRKNVTLFGHKLVEALKYAYGKGYGLFDIEVEPDGEMKSQVLKAYKQMIDTDYAAFIRDHMSIHTAGNQKTHSYYGKNIYSQRMSSTANICILSPNGDAIAISTSLLARKTFFIMSSQTGISLNNEMHNFEPLVNNLTFVRPGKRPISGHCPTIVVEKNNAEVRFIVGASGHETAPAQVISSLLDYWYIRLSAFDAANNWFFQPDVFNNIIYYGVHPFRISDEDLLNSLTKLGHVLIPVKMSNPYTARTCISHSFLSSDAQYSHTEEGSKALIDPAVELNLLSIFAIVGVIFTLVIMRCYEIIKLTE